MNIFPKLSNLRVVIVTHEYATGPSHALENYLRTKVKNLAFIAHPFVFAPQKKSHIRTYVDKQPSGREVFFPVVFPIQMINLLKDIALTVYWCLRFGRIDLYIGVDNINAGTGIILRKLGLVKQVIFYTIDYIPNRFSNPVINRMYHRLDAWCVSNANTVWNLSPIMQKEREHTGLSSQKIKDKQKVVPMGTDAKNESFHSSSFKRYEAIFVGHLVRKQGVQTVIKGIPRIRKILPNFRFTVIGEGPMKGQLEELTKTLRIQKYVTFAGYIRDHNDVERMLAKSAIAVAPYEDTADNFVRFTDPGKIKAYLSAGLPIIVTKVPAVWHEIEASKAGMAVSDSKDDLADAIIAMLSDIRKLRTLRANARLLGARYTWDILFSRALAESL